MRIVPCDYCGWTFHTSHPNAKYCPGKKCKSRADGIRKKLAQMKYNNTLEPRTCGRCLQSFRFKGMKKFCEDCLEILKEKPHYYRKEDRGRSMDKCDRCKEKPKWSKDPKTRYCIDCKDIAKREHIDRKNEEAKKMRAEKAANPPKMVKKSGEIDPYFLKRGNQSDNGTGLTQFNM